MIAAISAIATAIGSDSYQIAADSTLIALIAPVDQSYHGSYLIAIVRGSEMLWIAEFRPNPAVPEPYHAGTMLVPW